MEEQPERCPPDCIYCKEDREAEERIKEREKIKMPEGKMVLGDGKGPLQQVIYSLFVSGSPAMELGIPKEIIANPEVRGANILFLACSHWAVELPIGEEKVTLPGAAVHCSNCADALNNAVFKHQPPIAEEELPQLEHHREVFDREEAKELAEKAEYKIGKLQYKYYNADGNDAVYKPVVHTQSPVVAMGIYDAPDDGEKDDDEDDYDDYLRD